MKKIFIMNVKVNKIKAELKEKGVISDEEFQKAKEKILKEN